MSGIASLLVARGQRNTTVRHVVLRSFDQIVALFSADLVSYWKFRDATGTDEQGVANATITGSPEPDVPTIVKSDMVATGALVDGTCIAWPGTAPEQAQAAHNAAHKTASGTVIVYFQRDATTQKSQLIEADASGAVGGMAMGVNTNGAPDAYIRDGSGTPIVLNGGFGDVLLDRAYAVIFKWGTPGMSLALWNDAGAEVRRSTNLSTIGLSGISTLRFGATHNNTNHHHGPYARVVWLDRRITNEEEVLFAQALTIPRSAGAYRAVELGLAPIALWGLGEATGTALLDAIGTNHGTYAGTVVHNTLDLPTNQADGAVDFAGTGSGSIPHMPVVFAPAAFSLSCWFKATTIPAAPSGPAMCIIAKTGNGAPNLPGDFSVNLVMGNGSVLRTRFRDATATPGAVDIDTPVGTIVAGQTYHVCVRANNTGFELFLDGLRIGQNAGYTGAWSVNTQPITIAAASSFTALSNIIVDEVSFFNRFLTVAEILQLAQKTGVVMTANDFNVTVSELETTAIDILAHVDNQLGIPAIQIVDQPTPDTVNVVAAAGLARAFGNYVAGDVGGTTARSFVYQTVNSNGTSNAATASVSVTPDLGAPANANCYPATGLTNNVVSTMAQLQATLNSAIPGDHILMAPGPYPGALNINRQGTAARPIVIRPSGAVTIGTNSPVATGTWTFADTSAWVTVVGVDFNDGRISWAGDHNRIDRCEFRGWSSNVINFITPRDCRISRCEFHDNNPQPDSMPVPEYPVRCFGGAGSQIAANRNNRNLIDHCWMHDMLTQPAGAHPGGGNGQELFSFGANSPSYSCIFIVQDPPTMTFEGNLFERWNMVVEQEMISIKFGSVLYKNNTSVDCDGFINPRFSKNTKILSSWFEGHTGNVGGVGCNLYGEDHLVQGNHFVDSIMRISGGRGYMTDVPVTAWSDPPFHAARNCQVIHNTFAGTSRLQIGPTHVVTNNPFTVNCVNNNVFGNTAGVIDSGGLNGGHTTVNPGLPAVPAAVKILPPGLGGNVGLNATDPYCG